MTTAGRRETVINGTGVQVIDIHAHCVVTEAAALMGFNGNNATLPLDAYATRLADMDAQGIDVEALSINPFWYGADEKTAAEVIRVQNEALAAFVARRPDRFVALATVALQHPDLAAQQLEDGVKRLGLRGALVGGSVEGEEIADRRFDPFWAKAEELQVPIFIHPQGVPTLASRLQGNGILDNVIGNPLETTIALSHLVFEGTLERYPRLIIVGAHGGGYLPSYMHLSDAGGRTFPARYSPLPKQPTDYLRQVYVDSLVFTPEALRHLVAEMSSSHIVVGTDYPSPWTTTPVDHVLATPGLTDADRIAILGGTAARLLGIEG